MLKAEQVPNEAVKAAIEAWENNDQSFRPNAETIAAALNAWPGMLVEWHSRGPGIILPLPQEPRDE